jgi:hypothetical protein
MSAGKDQHARRAAAHMGQPSAGLGLRQAVELAAAQRAFDREAIEARNAARRRTAELRERAGIVAELREAAADRLSELLGRRIATPRWKLDPQRPPLRSRMDTYEAAQIDALARVEDVMFRVRLQLGKQSVTVRAVTAQRWDGSRGIGQLIHPVRELADLAPLWGES